MRPAGRPLRRPFCKRICVAARLFSFAIGWLFDNHSCSIVSERVLMLVPLARPHSREFCYLRGRARAFVSAFTMTHCVFVVVAVVVVHVVFVFGRSLLCSARFFCCCFLATIKTCDRARGAIKSVDASSSSKRNKYFDLIICRAYQRGRLLTIVKTSTFAILLADEREKLRKARVCKAAVVVFVAPSTFLSWIESCVDMVCIRFSIGHMRSASCVWYG